MKSRTYFRLLLFILIAAIGLSIFAYSHRTANDDPANPECNGKCDQNKTQTEFILWESISRNLLSFSN